MGQSVEVSVGLTSLVKKHNGVGPLGVSVAREFVQ